jgi:hypothetical protein
MIGPTIKLLTWWMIDPAFESRSPSDDSHIISHGIWEARSVFINEDSRAYEFVCIMPHHDSIKIGDKRKMYEDVVLAMCHPVTLTHLPKLDKRDVAIDNILKGS